jgi:hypothetical protein
VPEFNEISKPVGAVTTISFVRLVPNIDNVWYPDTTPAHVTNGFNVPATVIVGWVLEQSKLMVAGASNFAVTALLITAVVLEGIPMDPPILCPTYQY